MKLIIRTDVISATYYDIELHFNSNFMFLDILQTFFNERGEEENPQRVLKWAISEDGDNLQWHTFYGFNTSVFLKQLLESN